MLSGSPTSVGVKDTTQIHTHVCSSHFNGIIHSIIDMDTDVITIENSRSDEKLLSVVREGVKYGEGIDPGVYDIHSPRIPSTEEITARVNKMLAVLEKNTPVGRPSLWSEDLQVNRGIARHSSMVVAAKVLRTNLASAK